MAIHTSVLAWRIPWTGEPVGLLSMGMHRVRHDWSDLAAAAIRDGVYYMFGISFTSTLIYLAFLVAQIVKHLVAMWQTQVWSLGWEDPVEKEMATHLRTLVWKIPWTEKPGRLQSLGSQRVRYNWVTSLNTLEILILFFFFLAGGFYFFSTLLTFLIIPN